jgi:hypothetical protein
VTLEKEGDASITDISTGGIAGFAAWANTLPAEVATTNVPTR